MIKVMLSREDEHVENIGGIVLQNHFIQREIRSQPMRTVDFGEPIK